MLTLKLRVKGEDVSIHYPSPSALLEDQGLRNLFESGTVEKCELYAGGQRIAGLPIMDWHRLRQAVASNATAILKIGRNL